MASVQLTALAEADLDEVLTFTLTRFGPHQVSRYSRLFDAAFATLEAKPLSGNSRALARPGLLLMHIKQPGFPASHVLVYRYSQADDAVTVVRVLHEATDYERHLP